MMKEFLWELEPLILIAGLFILLIFLANWFSHIINVWPKDNRKKVTGFLSILPFAILLLILFFVLSFGTEDVVTDFYYILLYTVSGLNFVYLHIKVFERAVDISPMMDALHRNNFASLFPICGGIMASAIMYSCMNMGDGDGWWCVFNPYLLCWGFWLFLAWLYALITGISEKVTVEHDLGTGIRSGGYFVASGIMIAVFNIGNYDSFGGVLKDFLYCWSVLILFVTATAVELLRKLFVKGNSRDNNAFDIFSCLTVCIYIVIAVLLVKLFAPDIVWEVINNG